MQIKFQKCLSEFKYLVMFDLASKKTGVCVWDIQKNIPIKTEALIVSGKTELPASELYHIIDNFFQNLHNKMLISWDDILVYKEAMPCQLHGGASTVQTFIALARSHAILDLYTYEHNIAIYDYVGVYPITTHTYLKKLLTLDNKYKVEKTDIANYVSDSYGFSDITFDESDAIFLAKTFIEVKWDKDLQEEIRAVKRHQKSLKAQHAINVCLEEENRLAGLKRA